MDVKIGTFAEVGKIHSYNMLLEQSVLSLSDGRLDWEELVKGLWEKSLKSAAKMKNTLSSLLSHFPAEE